MLLDREMCCFGYIYKMKINICIILLFLCTITQIIGQDATEQWDGYMASYEDGLPGSTTLRMDLIHEAPIENLSYVLVTGITYETAREDGLPEEDTFVILHKIGDELIEIISQETEFSFTHHKERLEYYYIKAPKKLKEKLERFYKKNYANYIHYINIKEDKNWGYYIDFLYPNEDIQNYMGNESVVRNLEAAGDNLTKKRRVDHWLYFSSETDLKQCEDELLKRGFTVEFSGVNKESSMPYELQIWRIDLVDLDSIYPITTELRTIAKKNNGTYDGWDTTVERE